jgi:hypothetical protein
MTAGVFAAVALALAGGAQVPQPTDADWAWLDHARQAAFETLMPLSSTPDLIVTYFSYRDLYYEEPEAYFSIRSNPGDLSPSAHLVRPIGASVQKQLLQMHMDDRSATVADLVSRVKVSQTQVSGSMCGAVRRAVEAMLKLPPPEPEQDLLVMHPRVHRIIRVRGGQTVDLSLVNDYHPLVVWAGRSLGELQKCDAAK